MSYSYISPLAIDKVKAEIYEDEDEYNIPEHEYVQSHPLVQLKEKIYDDKPKHNITLSVTNINDRSYFIRPKSSVILSNEFWKIFTKDKVVYKYDKLLNENEYVIGIIDKYIWKTHVDIKSCRYIHDSIEYIQIIYLTNYGRFIKIIRDTNIILLSDSNYTKLSEPTNRDDINIYIKNSELYIKEYEFIYNNYYQYIGSLLTIKKDYPKPLDEVRLPLLTYKMPKLFLDVINAFNKASTYEMQTCCKRYLDITRESKRKHDVLTSMEFNKQLKEKDEAIKEKNDIIEEKDLIISQQIAEIARLKGEIAKIKSIVLSIMT